MNNETWRWLVAGMSSVIVALLVAMERRQSKRIEHLETLLSAFAISIFELISELHPEHAGLIADKLSHALKSALEPLQRSR